MPVIIKNALGVILPRLVGVSIDKLSITLDLPWAEQKHFIDALADWNFWGPKGAYKYAQKLPLGDPAASKADKTLDSYLLIQYGATPGHPNLKFLKVEWNPAFVSAHDVAEELNSISDGLYARLMYAGTITRIDFAADFAYLSIDSALFHVPGVSFSEVVTKSGHSIYLGCRDSWRHFLIYNKLAQLKKTNKKKPKWLHVMPEKCPVTRIEARLKPKQHTLLEVLTLPNPIAALVVTDFTDIATGDDAWAHFLDSVRFGGAPYALLKMTDKATHEQYVQRINRAPAKWWNAQRVWEAVPERSAELLAPAQIKQAA